MLRKLIIDRNGTKCQITIIRYRGAHNEYVRHITNADWPLDRVLATPPLANAITTSNGTNAWTVVVPNA